MYNSLQTAKPVYAVVHEADPTRAAGSGFLQRSPYYQTQSEYSGTKETKTDVIQGALELKYKFKSIDGLSISARLNFERTFGYEKSVTKPFEVWDYDYLKAEEGEDPWVRMGTQNTNNMYVYSDRSSELLPLATIKYDTTIGKHTIKAIAVGEFRTYEKSTLKGSGKDLISFETPFLKYTSAEGRDVTEGLSETARASFISRVNYDYDSKYLFEVAMRADASAEYAKDSRWGYFPSFSAGWRISEESFIQDNFSNLDNLKLRGSYGIMGNDAVSSFDYLTGYVVSTNSYVFGTSPSPIISSAGLANENITWETMKLANVGVDATFWGGKLGFELDYFYRLREDILATPTEQIPSTFGASLPNTNLNKQDNRGFELLVTHSGNIGEVSYTVSPMVSWARGKQVEVQESASEDEEWNNRYLTEGEWLNRKWGYISDGFFMNQSQVDNHEIDQDLNGNSTLAVGDIIYKDINEDGQIDWRDQKVIGSTGLPITSYSLDLTAQYKGLSVSMLWQGGAGYSVTISGSAAGCFSNESTPLTQHYDYRAIVGLDDAGMEYITNPDSFKLPSVTQTGLTTNNAKGSDFWTIDARYLRMKNINVSYSLPKNWISPANINSCQVYFSGTNLITFSNLGIWKDSFDPEIPGANNRDYPPVKTMTFGLKVTI